jgi:hypothetical protein
LITGAASAGLWTGRTAGADGARGPAGRSAVTSTSSPYVLAAYAVSSRSSSSTKVSALVGGLAQDVGDLLALGVGDPAPQGDLVAAGRRRFGRRVHSSTVRL